MIRGLWVLLGLLLSLAQIPFFGAPEEELKEPPSPVKGWWEVKYFGVPPTRYAPAEKGIIKAESVGSRSSLFKEVGEKERHLPLLSWGWKVSNVVRSAIETRKDRHDAAARVILIFGRERPFRRFGIGEPSGLKIEYIWAAHLPKGHLFDHPAEKHRKVMVVESGEARVGQWVYHQRDIQKDFKTAFGSEPPPLLAIGLQTDTDQSNEMVTAFYAEPRLRRRTLSPKRQEATGPPPN
ncbi:MAG: DUF3047 domain-containing protein [Desulfobacterota bacterium]|nr:DUF3047 domain-containing protein [Thermodesulfobacteriota bacterium]